MQWVMASWLIIKTVIHVAAHDQHDMVNEQQVRYMHV